MSNTYFQFKEFTMHQDKCAMKVSTDACIQGAWTPIASGVTHVLDIGCGTGLLSLMLAQRQRDLIIDAIELDADAAQQAKENVTSSPWGGNINVIQADVREYAFDKQYDMVICNPPFFNNSLLGSSASRNGARHTLSLTYEDLLKVIQGILKPEGYASVLLPKAEQNVYNSYVFEKKWAFQNMLQVHPRADREEYNRVISICSKGLNKPIIDKLYIYKEDGAYTESFQRLMQPFYLYL